MTDEFLQGHIAVKLYTKFDELVNIRFVAVYVNTQASNLKFQKALKRNESQNLCEENCDIIYVT